MAKQDIIISIQLKGAEGASKSTDQLSNATKKLSDLQRQEAIEVAKVNEQIKIQRDINTAAAKSSLGLAQSTRNTSEAFKASKTQAGLNNAILLESGRLASDASYGFTAMANNLSQLVSLFGSFVKTAGGVGESFKQLGKSLLGTGGVLLGVQLLIGALQSTRFREFITELNGISRAMRLLKESTEEATDVFGKQIGFLRTMETLLNDTTVSNRQKEIILKRVKKEHEDLNPLLDEEGKLTKESTSALEDYLVLLERKARSQSLLNTIEEEYIKLQLLQDSAASDNVSVVEVLIDKFKALAKGQSQFSVTSDLVVKGEENKQEEIEKTKGTISELTEELKKLGIFMDKDRKKGYGRREKDFKQQLLNLEKLEESYRQKSIDKELKTRDELINLEEENAKEELKIRVDSFKAKQKLRLEEFLETTEDADERKKANDEYNESIELADEEHNQVMIELESSFRTKRTQLRRTEFEEQMAEQERIQELERQTLDAKAELMDEESGIVGDYAFFERQRNVERMNEDIERAERVVRMEKEGSEAKAQAELSLHQLKKQLSEEEQAIQEEKFGFIMEQYQQVYGALSQTFEVSTQNQTIELEENYSRRIEAAEGNSDEQERLERELAVKKDKIARKQFERDKAMRVSQALMTVYQNGFLAYGSQLFPGDVTSPVRAAIQQAITIAAGLANVANIARQKYQSSVPSGGGAGGSGGAGGGMQIQAPDFNVVGASQTSQLAESVAGQQAKPVKAFVVGKDISTQQELDRNITNTASFG